MKKTIVAQTFIRDSDIRHDYFTRNADRYGGLIEFYRSPARVAWTPTGSNVPHYPRMARLWWPNVASAMEGSKTPQQAMDRLAEELDSVMASLTDKTLSRCVPKLNPRTEPKKYLSAKGAPWAKLANEKQPGETIPYAALLQAWREGRVR